MCIGPTHLLVHRTVYDGGMENNETKRLNLALDIETGKALEDIRTMWGVSNTEAIRRAVKLFRYVLTRQEEGWVFESNKRGETGRIMRILRPEDDTDPE